MAQKKNRRWMLIILVLLLLGSLASCCGCAGLWHFLPGMLARAFTQATPVTAPTVDPDPSVGPRLERALETGGAVAVSGQDLVQLVKPWEEEEIHTFWVDVGPDDRLAFTLSVYFDEIDRYFNIQAQGGMEIEHGWFTDFTVDELEISGWDLGQYVTGQQLAEHANRSAADQRAQDPDVALAMDQIEHLWLQDGALQIELAAGGWEAWQGMRR